MTFVISYPNQNGLYTIIDSLTEEIKDNIGVKQIRDTKKYPYRYEMFKNGTATHDGLREYLKKFNSCCKELRERKQAFVDYKKYYHNNIAVNQVFFENSRHFDFTALENISMVELKWINKCPNGGIMYAKQGEYKSFGYDFKSFYPRILGSRTDGFSFKFPTKQGKEHKFKKLSFNKSLKFGYYRVKITSDHPDSAKLFCFSKYNVYCNYSIEFVVNHLSAFGFRLELVVDGEPNAYIYDNDCLIESHKIFNSWYFKLSSMRKDFPKNMLLKDLMSSLSGHLMTYNTENLNMNDFQDEGKINIHNTCYYMTNGNIPEDKEYAIFEAVNLDDEEQSYYKILDLKNPMKYPVGRFKSFLMAFSRNITATACLIDVENVVRIHTDGITFNKEQDFSKYTDIPKDFIFPEDKTTGTINFKNVNSYFHICGCGYSAKFEEFKNHSC